jgi:hypothetical protein
MVAVEGLADHPPRGAAPVRLGGPGTAPIPAVRKAAELSEGPSISRPRVPGPWVTIALPDGSIDPWATFTVTAIVTGAYPGPLRYHWGDTLGDTGTGSTLTVTAPDSGTFGIGVQVWDVSGDLAEANATLGVGTSPSIAVTSPTPTTDVGLPIPIALTVGGGRPPYALDWQTLPGGPADSLPITAPSTVDGAVVATAPGFVWVRATVTDGFSISTSIQAIVATVHPSPTLKASPVARDVDAGTVAEVTGLVAGGTPPFQWTAMASLPAVNVTGATGVANASESIGWSGRFLAPGNSTVELQVVDAAGVPVSANASIQVFPALDVPVVVETADPSAGAPLNISAFPSGGVPPYTYSIVLSDNERSSGVLTAPAPLSWVAHPSAPGYLVVDLSVVDTVLGSDREAVTVVVGPVNGAAAVSTPNGTAAQLPFSTGGSLGTGGVDLIGGVGVAAVATLFLFALWRKRRPTPSPVRPGNPEAEETVRRLLEESGGTARATLKLLAEEEGVDAADFDAALGHWEAEGRVRVEAAPDGGSTLHWSPPVPAPAAGAKAPEGP